MICSNVYIILKFTFHVFILWSWNVLFSLLASPFILPIFCCCFSCFFFLSVNPWQFWWINEEMQTYILMEKKKNTEEKKPKKWIWMKGLTLLNFFSFRYYIIVFIWMITWIAFSHFTAGNRTQDLSRISEIWKSRIQFVTNLVPKDAAFWLI